MTTSDAVPKKSNEGSQAMSVGSRAKLAYLAMLIGGVVLAATGIGTFVLGKAPMSGWVLMVHVSAAPLFAIGLAVVALTCAERCRFGTGALEKLAPAKALFWLMLLSGLVVILSAVVPMTPLFGTSGQHALYLTHRYSAIVLTVAVVLHLLTRVRDR